MAKDIHPTPMLDDLETGPWPSFISGIKRLRDKHPEKRINEMANSLLGQLEHSYETRKGLQRRHVVHAIAGHCDDLTALL